MCSLICRAPLTLILSLCLAGALASAKAADEPKPAAKAAAALNPVADPKADTAKTESADYAAIEKKWGVRVSKIFLSGSGNMVDFRYVVIDPAKAAPLTKAENKPLLIHQTTGAKLTVPNSPKIGPLRQVVAKPTAGKMYFILFSNTRHAVKQGDKVTIAAGDFKAENLVVE